MFSNINWLFFDIGSTLVDETRAYQHRIRDTIAGSGVSYAQFYEAMVASYRANGQGYYEVAKKYGLATAAWPKEDEILYPEAVSCLRSLSKRYKIGIIANQSLGSAQRLEKWGLLDYIDLVIASAEEKVAKPDVKIFELALKRAQCMPSQAVMIGDRLDNDIVPAKSLGLSTIWIRQGFGGLLTPQTANETPDYTVERLDEIEELLRSEKR